mmetsp:Transcript_14556/g.23694  ORF Transcript_14556/g.23694 Transcript_14556/m.23694 type:complete len:537 (+) Transcript_14556:1150-2760(+)|eukprot:CAMPEP_0203760294 /NCGR_PEP_ID=MMETSP0098-20131031/13621_1 /ASSEMBLY_ACC=CAM_ASM_000208 /TAXON_ID=96639 /ORGANISM=" , Strain NY0313808BC1" /LENGTH=536 /DNA_ID=CAMNT_0050653801 /DNA_START=1277 /DNA_END=2887 /DNA_ORIENTATION=+
MSKKRYAFSIAAAAAMLGVLRSFLVKRRKERVRRIVSRFCAQNGIKVAICGGGMSGICMAIKLQQAGIPFTIFEQNHTFGGTWLHNNYPDAACDIPSHMYSYSFALKWDWSRKWAKRSEILAYFLDVANKHELSKFTRFNTNISTAIFGDDKQWHVTFKEQGEEYSQEETYTFFVSAVGQLSVPNIPSFEGMDSFKGSAFHTHDWDPEFNLSGKRVVGIGTGPSAIQAYPAIAPDVGHLTVIQRSPIWLVAKNDYVYSDFVKNIFRYIPGTMLLTRLYTFLFSELAFYALLHRRRFFRTNFIGKYYLQITMGLQVPKQMKNRDDFMEKVIPTYVPGCKRIGFSDGWVPMLLRDNVSLETSGISKIKADGIELKDGSFIPCEVIIFATGFQSTKFLSTLRVVNDQGTLLHDKWEECPRAYKSVAVSDFPNLFLLYGPGSNLGHNSIFTMVETQINYVVSLLEDMASQSKTYASIKPSAYAQDFKDLQDGLSKTVFVDKSCDSWYKNSAGQVVNNWYSSVLAYYWHMRPTDRDCWILR